MQNCLDEINKILKSISFEIKDADEELVLRSKFSIFNKSTFGSLLILFGGLFMIYITLNQSLNNSNYTKLSEFIPLILLGIISLLFITAGITKLYSVSTDFIKVNNSYIEFKSSSFKVTKIELNTNFRIIKKSRTEQIRSSTFRIIELYIDDKGNQKRILQFQMDLDECSEAHKLGNQLKSIISQKKNNYLQQGV